MQSHTCTRLPLGRRGQPGARRSVAAAAVPKPTLYDVLGVDIDCSEEDIKQAYRRKAKELHPDVSKLADAEEQFKACKAAYETLVDEARRAEYDSLHRVRRLNFFQDVDESDLRGGWGGSSSSPGRGTADPWEVHRRMWEAEEARTASTSGRDGSDQQQQQQQREPTPEELLERLSRVMGGWGSSPLASPFGDGGRLDPFGSGSSEAWHRRVEQQTNNPGFGSRGRPVYGAGDDEGEGWGRPSEWNPYRPGDDSFDKRQGWTHPGRQEWQAPRRRWAQEDEDDDGLGGRGGSTRGPGRGGIPGDGGFRGKPL